MSSNTFSMSGNSSNTVSMGTSCPSSLMPRMSNLVANLRRTMILRMSVLLLDPVVLLGVVVSLRRPLTLERGQHDVSQFLEWAGVPVIRVHVHVRLAPETGLSRVIQRHERFVDGVESRLGIH